MKFSNLNLNKWKPAIKNGTELTLNLWLNLIGNSNDETNFQLKLLSTNTKVSKIRKPFANGSSANIKFSKYQRRLKTMCSERNYVPFFMNLALNLTQDTFKRHRIKGNRTITKLSSRKDCHQVLRAKKRLKDLDGTTLNLPKETKIFIKESLCGCYRGLWNKCKRSKERVLYVDEWCASFQRLYFFFLNTNDLIIR